MSSISPQCKVAKVTCEKRIYDMTRLQKRAPHYADMRFRETETKLLELDEILYSPYILPFFVQVPEFLYFSLLTFYFTKDINEDIPYTLFKRAAQIISFE